MSHKVPHTYVHFITSSKMLAKESNGVESPMWAQEPTCLLVDVER